MKFLSVFCDIEKTRYGFAIGALACAGLWVGAAHAGPGPRLLAEGKLTVGLEYVVPAFVAGAKVRTPEGVDTMVADELGRRLLAAVQTTALDGAGPGRLLDEGRAGVVLAPIADANAVAASVAVIPTGYAAGAMAIMRSDTDIKQWRQLQGRTVCLAQGGRYVGQMAAKYGAIEKIYPAPADSLLTLRIGGCDAAVHDSAMLTELIKLPEWKKFSARLPVQALTPLAFVVASRDGESVGYLKRVVKDWAKSDYFQKTIKAAVNDIAFEVYLDQTVTDCH
ncbi:transporter substrate-binding domain-containing protein [Alcaligenaceae bacterium]|nr:transporter substrate-binding domain-containing protein [Alcaligenaceae bacterium]